MNKDAFRAPIGTRDILPPESDRWIAFVRKFSDWAARFGFGLILTPEFENVEVFLRLGETTDVVHKEMYDFEDKGGRRIALRPEGTAPVVRAFVQNRPIIPWKVWYLAPMFRYERPQKGRYRQHYQVGVEVLGEQSSAVDVDVIALADGFFRDLGLQQFRLLINSMGDTDARELYRAALQKYFKPHVSKFDKEFGERVEQNPLRLLDSKQPELQDVLNSAPNLEEFLSPESRKDFESVKSELQNLGIVYEIAPRLVRGFDYYTGTTFEFVSDAIDASQSTICGGGRYDKLAEEMGGPPTPGIGFGLGIDRSLLACEAENVFAASEYGLDVFLIDGTDSGEVTARVAELRNAGFRVDRTYGDKSLKAQWKNADRTKARYGVMIGADELTRNAVAVKDMQTGEQIEVEWALLPDFLDENLGKS